MHDHISYLLATNHPYLPQIYGGAQISIQDTASLLMRDPKCKVSVSSNMLNRGTIGQIGRIKLKLGMKASKDDRLGYPVYRSWHPLSATKRAIADAKPDYAIVQSMGGHEIAEECIQQRIPTLFYFYNLEEESMKRDPRSLMAIFLANSEYTKKRLENIGVTSRVLPPFYNQKKYKVDRSEANSVLFINPIKEKGIDIAVNLARACPDIPFIFAEAWWTSKEKREELYRSILGLPNVSVVPPRQDMNTLYARAKILLFPSIWNEAWGRAASEAHMSSIPVLASNIGGLPESVGPGGILVDVQESAEAWTREMRRLWDDPSHFQRISDAATVYSSRKELTVNWQTEQFKEAFDDAENLLRK